MQADLSRYLTNYFTGYHQKDLLKQAIESYQRAETLAGEVNQANQAVMRLALSQATFYYEQMDSVEFAIKHTASALILAKNAMPSYLSSRYV